MITERGPGGPGRPFLGRTGEVAALDMVAAALIEGRGGLAIVSGEPGIGKTALCKHIAAFATARGCRVVWGHCWEEGGAPGFWPWHQVLRALLDDVGDATVHELIGPQAGVLATAFPELAARFGGRPQRRATEHEAGRFALFDAVTSLLRRAAASAPLLVVLDDLHAADEGSLRLLRFAARLLGEDPTGGVGLLGAYRDVEARIRPGTDAILADVSRAAVCVRLDGLDAANVRGLAAALLGRPVDAATGDLLHQVSGGNPLFATELVRLVDTGTLLKRPLDAGRPRLPDQVREAMRQRVALLPQTTQTLLGAAAVLGRSVDAAVLAGLVGAPPADVVQGLEAAVDVEVLRRLPQDIPIYEFRHILMRDAIYEATLVPERMRLHLRAADQLEGRSAAPQILAEIARHRVLGAPLGGSDQAIVALSRAASDAIRRFAWEEAAERWQTAAQLAGDTADLTVRCDIGLGLGLALRRSERADEARAAFAAALAAARLADDDERFARAALGLAGDPQRAWSAAGRVNAASLAVLEEADARLSQSNSSLHAQVLSQMAIELYWSQDAAGRRDLSTRAIEMARNGGDLATLARCLEDRITASWHPVDAAGEAGPEARRVMVDELATLAERLDDVELRAGVVLIRVINAFDAGELASADANLVRLEEMATVLRSPLLHWAIAGRRVTRSLMIGDVTLAESQAIAALDIGQRANAPDVMRSFARQLAIIRWLQRRLGEEEPLLRQMIIDEDTWGWDVGLALALAEQGRRDEARSLLNRLLIAEWDEHSVNALTLLFMAAAAVAAAATEHVDGARRVYDFLRPFAGRLVTGGRAMGFFGPVDLHLGMLAPLVGEDPTPHHRAAIAAMQALGSPLWEAIARAEWAVWLASAGGDPAQAARQAALAEPVFAGCGLDARAMEARALRERVATIAVVADGSTTGRLRQEGEVWSVAWADRSVHVRDSRGFAHLAVLLARPGIEVHAADLVRGDAAGGEGVPAGAKRTGRRVAPGSGLGDAGPVLDDEAKRAYRRRLDELRVELAEAEEAGDADRAGIARDEVDALARELAAAVGLGGRDRVSASADERARISVTKAIHTALLRLTEVCPELAAHLDATVRTGTFCVYRPDPASPVRWDL